ncbi:SigE family RNA polymerase sigma factor [Stackebrandtia nassauensis]|uniref:RNA polymerase, sigma-24 subunit, ECF subfamily n=1 Tax=Stackebrandtia nassauensis (strain DSM 44728 / CIP 108903 / NRRL B-16338 / NBRC 102104 / LLR-40K-21) TaxID=446470 RepID=D3QB11_STANL|nr:SigE family RNA polymerase sigma factor [Stackebrandtia nassauensis]ADD40828.1 RNA polymerase, sigma-24 subunit, ECF subfamily [Stackebrandtia nassauensis DSM 44728]
MDHDRADSEFRDFVASRLDRLRRLAFLMCGDMHRAEDAVQLALAKLYAVWFRVEPDSLDAYVRRIVINTVKTQYSRLWTKREHCTSATPERAAGDSNARTADRVAILEALARLPRRQRAVVVLRFWEDRSVAETAEIMRCSQGAVKSHTSRGLGKLRDLLSDTYSLEGMVVPCRT